MVNRNSISEELILENGETTVSTVLHDIRVLLYKSMIA